MKALIVEDDKVSRLLVEGLLKGVAECQFAVNGNEALTAVEQALDVDKKPFDLICLDINMPEMDGLTALKRIREIEDARGIGGLSGVKIVMLTALNSSKEVLGAFKMGCEAYIVKPIKREQFYKTLEGLGFTSTEASKT